MGRETKIVVLTHIGKRRKGILKDVLLVLYNTVKTCKSLQYFTRVSGIIKKFFKIFNFTCILKGRKASWSWRYKFNVHHFSGIVGYRTVKHWQVFTILHTNHWQSSGKSVMVYTQLMKHCEGKSVLYVSSKQGASHAWKLPLFPTAIFSCREIHTASQRSKLRPF